MTLSQILELDIIEDDTMVYIRDENMNVLAHGNWYQDNILNYLNCGVESFTWQDDGNFYINLK